MKANANLETPGPWGVQDNINLFLLQQLLVDNFGNEEKGTLTISM